jgi:hypothetical protein
MTHGGHGMYRFTITYTDVRGISMGSLGNGNIMVVGPRHYSAKATLISTKRANKGATVTATYAIPAPNGSWDFSHDGAYFVKLLAHQVADNSGNFALQRLLGTLQVNIPIVRAMARKSGSTLLSGV